MKVLFALCLCLILPVHAQQAITYKGLHADWYEGDRDPAIVLVHGTLGHKRMEIIETFATLLNQDYGYSVLAINLALNEPDRRGMAQCDRPHRHLDTHAAIEIGQWIEYLGDRPISLVGHSRGGAQVAEYLADPASSVVAASLIAPAQYDSKTAEQDWQERTGTALEDWLATADQAAPDEWLNPPRFIYCESAKVTAQSFLSYHQPSARFDTPALLKKVSVPVQVLWGNEDALVEGLVERLDPQQIQINEIDGADHFFRDFYADDAVAEIDAFINR